MLECYDPEPIEREELSLCPVILIGEDNPLSAAPEFALYPRPDHCSGHRLMKILGMDENAYLALHRTNLCARDAWSMREARRRANLMLQDPSAPWRVIVMLGRKVADAFDYEQDFFTHGIEPGTATWRVPITLVSLPHPSGRNLIWTTTGTRERARRLLRDLAPSIAWGQA